ncbi:MFS transporter [Planctomyces sp. SH-PL14]|uniref:MFS transporter n=1 Tax=Planctomyces sp. SH-PL14 TaxID=1632864 RepID=UPI00078ED5AA|nr:MFS transporter [Planctomyces sp. SH-PL14]AMV19372.1 Fosmidomycin resistance protein [Planctomyces sp. SH-PL14]
MSQTAAASPADPSLSPAGSTPAVLDPAASLGTAAAAHDTVMPIILALSLSHMLNDTLQALLPAIYPVLKESYKLTFSEIGLITMTFQCTSSLLQPLVGSYTDKRPMPYSLAIGMGSTLIGLLLLSQAHTLGMILLAAALVGTGSSVFHPEASRLAYMAAGGRHGFAQSLFQVGGNFGSAMGPLLAAAIVVPRGQGSLALFSLIAIAAILVLSYVGRWYGANLHRLKPKVRKAGAGGTGLSSGRVAFALVILVLLIISKYFYMVSLSNYYTFYLIDRFGVSVQTSQYLLFVFLFAVAAGTIAGGPIGDRFGRKIVIWVSILGVAPFSLALPYAGFYGTIVLSAIAGALLASAFSAIIVFAQELLPGKVGLVAGLFFGFAFGISGIAASALGQLADRTSIEYVFRLCSYFPLLGLLTVFLPNIGRPAKAA